MGAWDSVDRKAFQNTDTTLLYRTLHNTKNGGQHSYYYLEVQPGCE